MKKGFTLIELLAVIVILAIILLIATPQILSIINDSRLKSFNSSSNILEKSTSTYLSANDMTITSGTTTAILYSDMKSAGYIGKIIDPLSKTECTHSRVYVTNTNGIYTYKGALVCDNYMDIDEYNLINNSDFSSGTTGWSVYAATHSVTSNILTNAANGVDRAGWEFKTTTHTTAIGKKYYARCRVRVTNASATSINIYTHNGTNSKYAKQQDSPVQNQWYILSGIVTQTEQGTTPLSIYIAHWYANAATANGKVMQADGTYGVYLFDLTSIYGAGNEPTAAQMDKIMNNMGK